MQYWQRRLHRSVTDTRRLRSGRAKRSRRDVHQPRSLSHCGFAFLGRESRPRGCVRGHGWALDRCRSASVGRPHGRARGGSAQSSRLPCERRSTAGRQPTKANGADPAEERGARRRRRACRRSRSRWSTRSSATASWDFRRVETNRYLIDILKKNGFTSRKASPAFPRRSSRRGDPASR